MLVKLGVGRFAMQGGVNTSLITTVITYEASLYKRMMSETLDANLVTLKI